MAEAEELVFARDRITCALADRVGRVHRAGQARRHGHASTRSWLRTAAGMTVAGAGRLLTLGIELARLPRVREKFAVGGLAAGVVEAICAVISGLSDEHAAVAEPILLELAGRAGAAEVARAGRYLRAVLDPAGEDRDERADHGRRFLRVRRGKGGGLEGEFYLPREHAARLQALLDAYARPKAEGDDRPLRVRQADAFMALLEEKIAAELLVLVNAESLPADPTPGPETSEHPEAPKDTQNSHSAQNAQSARNAEAAEDSRDGEDTSAPAEGDTTDVASTDPVDLAETADLATGPHEVQSGDDATGRHEHQWSGQGEAVCGCGSRARCSTTAPETPRTPEAPGARGPEPGPEQGTPQGVLGPEPERPPGGEPGSPPGASAGGLPGALAGALLGAVLGTAPGLLLATGQVLPVSSVHRLARTSTLVRLVMDADGQVLDMGRKVRLATPAQRRAIFTRYATCWIDGCPLPATRCQIDHADNWSTGGLTDLKLLGPACQFHNRDRYQHPDRYTRRKTGKDRWAFTYHPARTRRLRI
ncbi:HNH endonuclease signature motif containing protein [Microbispora sp. H10836]|uniref:HNH endonuclease signature motif containing protein n=1 Tax=Microbispora sp. H10836 TaxID=2729106 RepID=UPI001474E23A|nr:HNH endonuclease signature motif containing protein [Microbispora sp. H10836]